MASSDSGGQDGSSPPLIVTEAEGVGNGAVMQPTLSGKQDGSSPPLIVTEGAGSAAVMQPTLQSFRASNTFPSGEDTAITNSSPQQSPHPSPQATITPAHKLSALHLDSPEGGVTLLQPRTSQQRERRASEVGDYTKLIDDFNAALQTACEAGKALQQCCDNRGGGGGGGGREEQCPQELQDYREKCSELTRYEMHLKSAYEEEYRILKERLRRMEEKERETSRQHEADLYAIRESHSKDMKEQQELFTRMHARNRDQALVELQYSAADAAELKKLRSDFESSRKEVDKLRSTLAEKEKQLYQLGKKILAMEAEQEKRLLLSDKEYTEAQLERCEQIREMVSKLGNLREMSSLVQEIFKETAKMKASNVNKRSTSWRR